MQKCFDLRQKKVIDIDTAEQVGYISDLDIDVKSGKINSVSIPKYGILGFFSPQKSITIPWNRVIAIGKQYILIKREHNLQKSIDNADKL